MLELFRMEAENQTAVLTSGLLALERGPPPPEQLEVLMRAAHSLKGAARIVNLPVAVHVAHAMEDCFVAAQHGKIELRQPVIDVLFCGVDLFTHISKREEANIAAWETDHAAKIQEFLNAIAAFMPGHKAPTSDVGASPAGPATTTTPEPPAATSVSKTRSEATPGKPEDGGWKMENSGGPPLSGPASSFQPPASPPPQTERMLRLTAENLNRLLGLAGESLVESRWLRPFSDSMQRLKRMQSDLEHTLDGLRQELQTENLSERSAGQIKTLFAKAAENRQFLADRLQELDLYDRRSAHLSNRLYLEALRARMRPFADGTQRFPRMVRDLARSLGKQARLEIIGENTQVDRDILERLETPLAHLLRNAVDHGCETPDQRRHAGKPPEAVIQLEARHSAGMLQVVVSDDGAGVDPQRLRRTIVDKQLTTPALAEKMQEPELLEFLFLPGFTLKHTVTEISGRGVGLDVVQNMVKAVRGSVRVLTQPGRGTKFQLQLPLTLSVLRTLLVEVGGEPYAIPLSQIARTLKLPREKIEVLEGRHFFSLESRVQGREPGWVESRESRVESRSGPQPSALDPRLAKFDSRPSTLVALHTAHEVLGVSDESRESRVESQAGPRPSTFDPRLSVVVLAPTRGVSGYGLVVDRFIGERELVVQPLDPRLGKVKDISAAALMEDGAPVLIVDVDDMVRSIEKLIQSGRGPAWLSTLDSRHSTRRKRILAVDDSLTVRELERKLLLSRGYLADVAVDGLDAWERLKAKGESPNSAFSREPSALAYDLVITDVDMPRMDGIELATLIKQDAQLKSLPVLIVSYKEREEDRLRGLNAGADYYLTKGSFHDERLLEAVLDLIGEPES